MDLLALQEGNAVACGDKKLSFQTHRPVPEGTRRKDPGWQFIRKCLEVLEPQAYLRRIRLEAALETGTVTTSQESESEPEMDRFLEQFKFTETWAAVSNPSP
ncbi:hypothetical protein CY34DRAFT_19992 [Suillus luteus UH-Slu-Lm8-n1]|uniref:Uncharacterized protein n=1 Tax=Suillus luteus UH-Slu-Lm8-n1 TaxID=930992 RepID=A0A0C9ZQ15_9AGAM|nr:hypothetical protein CY34DRAFT_19992 [Suillus luteus UH-Slu-Lm8-n1]